MISPRKLWLLFIFLININLIIGVKIKHLKEDPVVQIENGLIKGKILNSKVEKKEFFAFRGIPFAKPPLDKLRFLPPVPVDNWTDVLDAGEYKSQCVQRLLEGGNEDCLYLNVFSTNLDAKDLPVMVWIYGGTFTSGDASDFKPDNFMEKDVVIVTINYRVGIFGFYSTEDEVAPGNVGIKDQILTLKWVQANIASFGGDPQKVTVFGQSAGAACISYLLQTPLTKGLFRAAIMQSGSSLNSWALARNKRINTIAMASYLGLNTTDSRIMLSEFQQVDAQKLSIVSIIFEALGMFVTNPIQGMLFAPSVEHDHPDAIITGKSYEKLKNGDFHQIPILMGSNSEEAIMLQEYSEIALVYFVANDIFPERFNPIGMNINSSLAREVGLKIHDSFFPNQVANCSERELIRFFSEDQYERPVIKTMQLRSQYTPVYFYYFSYIPDSRKNSTIPGANHGDELKYLWEGQSSKDWPLTTKMVTLWTNFAKFLNPTPIVDPVLENVTWLPYSEENSYINISDTLTITNQLFSKHWDLWEEIPKYGTPPFDTY